MWCTEKFSKNNHFLFSSKNIFIKIWVFFYSCIVIEMGGKFHPPPPPTNVSDNWLPTPCGLGRFWVSVRNGQEQKQRSYVFQGRQSLTQGTTKGACLPKYQKIISLLCNFSTVFSITHHFFLFISASFDITCSNFLTLPMILISGCPLESPDNNNKKITLQDCDVIDLGWAWALHQ